jgi:invasion protein IalB
MWISLTMNLKNILSLLIFISISSASSYADINTEKWSHICSKNEKKNCEISIKAGSVSESGTVKTLAKAFILMGTISAKKMNLVSQKDQTYKLDVQEKITPVLFVELPLNIDLRQGPLVIADKQKIGNLIFLHCNPNIGCKSMLTLNEKVIELFKNGKDLKIVFRVFQNNKNFEIKLPLKGFTASYKKLLATSK